MLTRRTLLFICLLSLLLLGAPVSRGAGNDLVMVVSLEGVITVASSELVAEALESAERIGASALVIAIDTPGGVWDSTQGIIGLIERSNIPVIAYVHPRGATAWSAGTYIVVSSHVAAMSPFSIIGSCQPRTYPSN
jgi:membrane-bound serine protease (ClpP class)